MKIIDIHSHLGKFFFPIEENDVSDILKIMDKNDIEKIVLSSSLGLIYNFIEGNQILAKTIKNQDRLYGWIFINPNYPEESIEEIEKYLPSDKFIGLGELYHYGYIGKPIDCPEHRYILKRLQKFPERKRIVLWHCYDQQAIDQLVLLARDFPEISFIMAHAGGLDWRNAIPIVKEIPNLYIEICSGLPVRGKIEYMVKSVGVEKILFGADITLLNPNFTYGMIFDAEITEKEKELILYKNAKNLLSFS